MPTLANEANEFLSTSLSDDPAGKPQHDAAGNLVKIPNGTPQADAAIYDAWNRLAKVFKVAESQ